MYIRSNSWGEANLSWAHVIENLLHAFENLGNEVHFISTNGTKGLSYWDEKKHIANVESERKMRKGNENYKLDITFTAPPNFPQRFLPTSKVKMAIYDYESSCMPPQWKKFYNEIDYVLPASNYVADMFKRNGCPENKIIPIHHGVKLEDFNPQIAPMNLQTSKKFKFLCVAAPHYRKQLDKLLEVYCSTFTNNDDVSLILKTTIFADGQQLKPFEMDLRPVLLKLRQKYGSNIPEIKIINRKIENMGSLYTACQAFVLMTASEGWGIPYLEAMACGVPVIAPRHGGQLDFLNDKNSLLCDTGTRLARPQEQYWNITIGATVGDPDQKHFGSLMKDIYNNYTCLKSERLENMLKTSQKYTWESAAQKILNVVNNHGEI